MNLVTWKLEGALHIVPHPRKRRGRRLSLTLPTRETAIKHLRAVGHSASYLRQQSPAQLKRLYKRDILARQPKKVPRKSTVKPPLHVYLVENPQDGEVYHWVAKSARDALALHVDETYGGTVADYRNDYPEARVAQLSESASLTISFPPTSCDPEGRDPETRTLAEWVERRGRGLLCSTVDETR